MQFYIVYIREAHALDSRAPMDFGMVEDPIDLEERSAIASKCVTELDLPMPALVDTLDDAVNKAYRGWPDRLYLVDTEGKIAYAGGRGPFYFSPNEWEKAIVKEVAKNQKQKKHQEKK